jgi:hypothetical protein
MKPAGAWTSPTTAGTLSVTSSGAGRHVGAVESGVVSGAAREHAFTVVDTVRLWRMARAAPPNSGERIGGWLVGVRQGVKVLLGGGDAGVAHPLLDHLQVCAAGEQPWGVRVTEIVGAHTLFDTGGLKCGEPNGPTEPVAGHVAVRVSQPRVPGLILAHGASLSAVDAIGVLAVSAPALSGGVATQSPVPVPSAGGGWFGQIEPVWIEEDLQARLLAMRRLQREE